MTLPAGCLGRMGNTLPILTGGPVVRVLTAHPPSFSMGMASRLVEGPWRAGHPPKGKQRCHTRVKPHKTNFNEPGSKPAGWNISPGRCAPGAAAVNIYNCTTWIRARRPITASGVGRRNGESERLRSALCCAASVTSDTTIANGFDARPRRKP
jgi:hypothetical protein